MNTWQVWSHGIDRLCRAARLTVHVPLSSKAALRVNDALRRCHYKWPTGGPRWEGAEPIAQTAQWITRIALLTLIWVAVALCTLVPSVAAAQVCAPPPNGIVAWWPMDEASGTTVSDIVGSHPGIRVNGPVSAVGQVGGALRFNGGGSYVGAPDSDLWAFGNAPFTIELWANWDSNPVGSVGHPGTIFIGNDEGSGTTNKWFFALGGGFLNFHINGPTVGSTFLPLVPFSPTVGQWYHLAVTRQGTTFTIYINGIASGSATVASAIPNPNSALTIGQAESLGFMNGRLDEISVYNRALSQAELQGIFAAGSAGKCKQLTITTPSLSAVQLGVPFSQQLQASFGQTPYSWSVVSGSLPPGVSLSASGALSGTPTAAGQFTFTVAVRDNLGSQATKAFTLTDLITLPPSNLRITKTGTLAVPGKVSDYFILVENIGLTTANNVSIVEFLQLANFSLVSVDPPALSDVATLADAYFIPWNIATLAPGQATILTYRVLIKPTVPIGQIIAGTACTLTDVVDAAKAWAYCIVAASATPAGCPACANACSIAASACASTVGIPFDLPFCLSGLAGCGACIAANARVNPICAAYVGTTLGLCQDAIVKTAETGKACYSFLNPVKGAIDPNEKTVTAGKFVRPNQLLVYPIHYENIGTAPADNVFVTDVLSGNVDASTLQILTPGATYNSSTRTISWSLLGANLQPGATGTVLYQIRPVLGLPSGTEIHNSATIKFDIFAPMTTNDVVNVIDTTLPVSSMAALPWRSFSPNFQVSWNGSDAIGQIASFTIFQSINGGPFVPLISDSSNTQAAFVGSAGNTYRFVSIARDTAGNVEVKQPVAEATVLVSLPGDVNGDGLVDCADIAVIKSSFGKRTGQVGFSILADVNNDGVVNVFDLAYVTQRLPTGTRCQ